MIGTFMDLADVLDEYSLTDFPVGIGGCHQQSPMECCEQNVTVFDEKEENDMVEEVDRCIIRIHHGSLNESRSNVLVQLCDMSIYRDTRFELGTLLSKLNERRGEIFNDSMKNSLLDSLFCNARAHDGLEANDMLAPAWLKCAAFYLADAICLSNGIRPSPTHMLKTLRGLDRNPINVKLAAVNSCLGIERATPELLERMANATSRLSDIVEDSGHSKIIWRKYSHMVGNRLIADCYFYLGYVARNIMVLSRNSILPDSEMAYILKVALDLENDVVKIAQQCTLLRGTANEILSSLV